MGALGANGKQPEFNPEEAMIQAGKALKEMTDFGIPTIIVYLDPGSATHTNPNGVQLHYSLKKDVSVVRMLGLAVDRIGEVMTLKEGTSKAGLVLPSGMPAPEVRGD